MKTICLSLALQLCRLTFFSEVKILLRAKNYEVEYIIEKESVDGEDTLENENDNGEGTVVKTIYLSLLCSFAT